MAKESAEEKLLKMMQKSTTSAAVKPLAPATPKKKFKFTFTIATLNAFLFLGILFCVIALGFEMQEGFSLLSQPVQLAGGPKTEASGQDIALPSTHSTDYYLQKINERNIFKPYVAKSAQKTSIQGLAQLMSKYKLVGIAWLDLPETASVMIEDTQDNKTFFLKQGEQLEGVTVKTIYTDRAVFSHENEEMTIKL